MGGSSSIPDKRIKELCEGIQSANRKDTKVAAVEVAALIDAVLAVRDDPVLHRRLFLPFYGEEKPDTLCPGSPFLAVCGTTYGLALARRMVFESVDFGLEDSAGSGAPGGTAISNEKRSFIQSGPIFSYQSDMNGVRFVTRWWLNGTLSLEMYQFLVHEVGFKLFEERDHFGYNVLHYASQSYPRPELDGPLWAALSEDLFKLPPADVVSLLRGDDTNKGISVLAYASHNLCMSYDGALERLRTVANLCKAAGVINIPSKGKVVLNGEGGSGANEFISLCTNLHPSVEAMRILADVGVEIHGATTHANHNGLFVLASGPCGECMWVPNRYIMACEYLGVPYPPPHSSAVTTPPTTASPYSEHIFATSTESGLDGSNAFLEAAKKGQYLMTDLFLRSVSPADRTRLLATTTTAGKNAVHLCLSNLEDSNFNRSGHVLFSLIRHMPDPETIRSLVFDAKDNNGNTPLDLLYMGIAKCSTTRESDVEKCGHELRYIIAVLGACLPDGGDASAVFESPLFVKINRALTSSNKNALGDPVVDGEGVVSPALRSWLLTPMPLDREYKYEKREERLLNLAVCCTSTQDGALSPDQRQVDAMYYKGGVKKGAAPKSLLPVREYNLTDFYKHHPLGYSSLLGVNGPALRVVASNVFASVDNVVERTTAVSLGALDQTPFQVLLRRVALHTMDPLSATPNPNGDVVLKHLDLVVDDRHKAALAAEELKAMQKARAARNELLLMGGIVVVLLAWLARKMGMV